MVTISIRFLYPGDGSAFSYVCLSLTNTLLFRHCFPYPIPAAVSLALSPINTNSFYFTGTFNCFLYPIPAAVSSALSPINKLLFFTGKFLYLYYTCDSVSSPQSVGYDSRCTVIFCMRIIRHITIYIKCCTTVSPGQNLSLCLLIFSHSDTQSSFTLRLGYIFNHRVTKYENDSFILLT